MGPAKTSWKEDLHISYQEILNDYPSSNILTHTHFSSFLTSSSLVSQSDMNLSCICFLQAYLEISSHGHDRLDMMGLE